jgi:hypothetical protein
MKTEEFILSQEDRKQKQRRRKKQAVILSDVVRLQKSNCPHNQPAEVQNEQKLKHGPSFHAQLSHAS